MWMWMAIVIVIVMVSVDHNKQPESHLPSTLRLPLLFLDPNP